MPLYVYVFLTLSLSVAGQLFLKTGMLRAGDRLSETAGQAQSWLPVMTSLWVWAGLICWAGSTVFWMVALSRSPLSHIHGLNALSYVLIPLIASLCFGEVLHLRHWIGFVCITVGVILILNPDLLQVGHGPS